MPCSCSLCAAGSSLPSVQTDAAMDCTQLRHHQSRMQVKFVADHWTWRQDGAHSTNMSSSIFTTKKRRRKKPIVEECIFGHQSQPQSLCSVSILTCVSSSSTYFFWFFQTWLYGFDSVLLLPPITVVSSLYKSHRGLLAQLFAGNPIWWSFFFFSPTQIRSIGRHIKSVLYIVEPTAGL